MLAYASTNFVPTTVKHKYKVHRSHVVLSFVTIINLHKLYTGTISVNRRHYTQRHGKIDAFNRQEPDFIFCAEITEKNKRHLLHELFSIDAAFTFMSIISSRFSLKHSYFSRNYEIWSFVHVGLKHPGKRKRKIHLQNFQNPKIYK